MPSIKLLSVENHGPLAYALKEMLGREPELELVGEAKSAQAALDLLPDLKPDAVILDLSLPDMGGLEVIPLILGRMPSAKIILLIGQDEPRYQQAATAKGACACVRKDLIATNLIPTVKKALVL